MAGEGHHLLKGRPVREAHRAREKRPEANTLPGRVGAPVPWIRPLRGGKLGSSALERPQGGSAHGAVAAPQKRVRKAPRTELPVSARKSFST
jgi:hypothetical protein